MRSSGVNFEIDPTGQLTTLHDFTGKNDGGGQSAVILDSKGNLFGTALGGGAGYCDGTGCGTVFVIAP